ncbi:MAG: hypothetical protein V3W18_04275 [candidate division Zixibacteria bacterium]
MRKSLVLILIVALSGIASAGDSGKNICYTEDIEVKKGTSFAVPIILDNSDSLVALQLPVYYRSEDVDLVCDSVSFVDTRLAGESMTFFKIEPVGKVAFFVYMSMIQIDPTKSLLNSGKGPIAKLWFTANSDIKPGKVTIDSGPHAYYPHEWIDYGYHFWVMGAGEELTIDVDCEFKPGNITVK